MKHVAAGSNETTSPSPLIGKEEIPRFFPPYQGGRRRLPTLVPSICFTLLLLIAVPASAAVVDDSVYPRLAHEGAARVLIELAPGDGSAQRADLLRSVA